MAQVRPLGWVKLAKSRRLIQLPTDPEGHPGCKAVTLSMLTAATGIDRYFPEQGGTGPTGYLPNCMAPTGRWLGGQSF